MSKVFSCVADIMADVGAILKSRENKSQGFSYRGIDEVYNRLHPLLVKHRCFLAPEILEFSQVDRPTKSGANMTYSKVKTRYRLTADDGSNVSVDVVGEANDSGDKSAAKAQSIAYKIAMFSLFCIPTEELPDPDAVEVETDGDPALALTVRKAIYSTKSLEKLNEMNEKYQVRKAEGKFSVGQIAEIEQTIAEKIKSLAGGK